MLLRIFYDSCIALLGGCIGYRFGVALTKHVMQKGLDRFTNRFAAISYAYEVNLSDAAKIMEAEDEDVDIVAKEVLAKRKGYVR